MASLFGGLVTVDAAAGGLVLGAQALMFRGQAMGGVSGLVPETVLTAGAAQVDGAPSSLRKMPEVLLQSRQYLVGGQATGAASLPALRLVAVAALAEPKAFGDLMNMAPPGRRYRVWK